MAGNLEPGREERNYQIFQIDGIFGGKAGEIWDGINKINGIGRALILTGKYEVDE
jgi:hypothetical protein